MNNERQRRQKNITVYIWQKMLECQKKKNLSKLLKEVTGKKIGKEILEMIRIGIKVAHKDKKTTGFLKILWVTFDFDLWWTLHAQFKLS